MGKLVWKGGTLLAPVPAVLVTCSDGARDNVFTVRGMRVFSRKLNLSGACDVVEFHKDKNGISLEGQPGFWLPYPIEYKHGREKETDADRLQLCLKKCSCAIFPQARSTI